MTDRDGRHPTRRWSRREFLAAGLSAPVVASLGAAQRRPRDPVIWTGRAVRIATSEWRALGAHLAGIPDLRQRFIFEYYPWYETDPWFHWDENLRVPPVDVASFAVPRLGAYDSGSAVVIAQHARWIAEAGVGAVNLSWWGRESSLDRRVHLIMDVMRDHDIRVAFHVEPYSDTRVAAFRDDILYLLREYGEKRRWDTMLLVDRQDGSVSPVFKSFAPILREFSTDCLGVTRPVSGYAPDSAWRAATDGLRADLAADFAHVMLLCDTIDPARVSAAGFDGLGLYDPFVVPTTWPSIATGFSSRGLVAAFNVNMGFDKYPARGPQGPCFSPSRMEPPVGVLDWSTEAGREVARLAAARRFAETMRLNITLQAAGATAGRQGPFLAYINSFNEWHEGTAFEPALDYAELSADQRAIGYHNPTAGRWRLDLLRTCLTEIYAGATGG